MNKQITSLQNPYIKELVLLKEKSRIRKNSSTFLIEGFREILLAIKGNYQILSLLVDTSIISINKIEELKSASKKQLEIIEISNNVYTKLATRTSTEGVIAIAKSKELLLKSLQFKSNNPFILVAEAPEKPGNIGALLRTADAAGIDAVLIANPQTDMYNPNIIRTSVGCLFTTQVATGSTHEIIDFLKNNNIKMYGAALTASIPYHTVNFIGASALIVGTESTGLSDKWLENTTKNIKIPMRGVIDSMNVSVSAAILVFEAMRQRNFN